MQGVEARFDLLLVAHVSMEEQHHILYQLNFLKCRRLQTWVCCNPLTQMTADEHVNNQDKDIIHQNGMEPSQLQMMESVTSKHHVVTAQNQQGIQEPS